MRRRSVATLLVAAAATLAVCLAAPGAARAADGVDMHRLYNRWTGEHFYTASATERSRLEGVGWTYEGVGWVAPTAGDEVYRLYNPYVAGGDHHYTRDRAEYERLAGLGWRQEGRGWYSGGSVELYRQYNPYARTGTHNYTTDKDENDALVKAGWRAEGVGWYGVEEGRPAIGENPPAFVETARKALNVPDDPSITYWKASLPSYWEGARAFVWRIYFYDGDEVRAGALCNHSGEPARDILTWQR